MLTGGDGAAEVLRDAKRLHFLWQPTTVQQEAIDKCIDTCLPQVKRHARTLAHENAQITDHSARMHARPVRIHKHTHVTKCGHRAEANNSSKAG